MLPDVSRQAGEPHLQSSQVQFSQVQSGFVHVRATSLHSQFSQVQSTQVQFGFAQVVVSLMLNPHRW